MRDRDLIGGSAVDTRRFWCAYTDLEEYHAGMWKPISHKETQSKMVAQSVALLRSQKRFTRVSREVLDEWPMSCKAEFTSPGNHLAWLGCAACCFDSGVPEDLTRRAWWKLTDGERTTANSVARSAITRWINDNTVGQLVLFA